MKPRPGFTAPHSQLSHNRDRPSTISCSHGPRRSGGSRRFGTGATKRAGSQTVKADLASTDKTPGATNGIGRLNGRTGPWLVAGMAALLQRYTDRSHVTVGYAEAPGAHPVPLRLDLSDDPPFSELVDRVLVASRDAHARGEASLSGTASSSPAPGQDRRPRCCRLTRRRPAAGRPSAVAHGA